MKCPGCGHEENRVTDSRDFDNTVRRRRLCLQCGFRFTTYERVQTGNLAIIKKDHRREPFNREKLASGIRKACEKRPLPTGTVEKLVDDIETELHRAGKAEIPSSAVGEMVMERLKALDHIAYIRFASVYRDFADITCLKQEVDTLIANMHPASQLPLLPDEEIPAPGRKRKRMPANYSTDKLRQSGREL
ncbi:MAG: transcriptional repressor NrdR [Dehalococcoidia bacterium]|nr:transcriptional repressor NrdR [Dehalococcoidia bacterium]